MKTNLNNARRLLPCWLRVLCVCIFSFLSIEANSQCSTPNPGNTLSSAAIVCAGTSVTLSVQNPTPGVGVTYQWEQADDSAFTINVITLGTAPVQTTSANAAAYYRCQVTCSAGPSTVISDPVLVDVYDPVLVYAAGLDLHCHGDNLGEVYLSVSGGTGTYTYNWNGGLYTTQNISTLPPGTYSVVVTDGNGCSANTSTIVSEPPSLVASSIVSNVSAFGMNDGSITLNAIGGTTPYTYSINAGLTYVNPNVFNGLSATMYTAYVKDAANCISSLEVPVLFPTTIVVDPGIYINVSDDRDSIAHIVWGVPSSFPAYTYVLERSNDNVNFVGIESINTPNLVDIMSLPASAVNPFGGILFTTEMQPRLMYNQVIPNLTPDTRVYYRVKISNQSQTMVVYSTTQQFLPAPILIQPWPVLNPIPCPPIGFVPPGYTPTPFMSTQLIGCCLITKRLYVKYGCMPVVLCKDCVPACNCTSDPCCVHNCTQYGICGCTPWPSCGTQTLYAWVVIGSVYQAPLINTTQTNVSCHGGSNGSIIIQGPVQFCKRNKIIAGPPCFTATHPLPWPNALGQISNVFNGLCAGCYVVMVTDCNGCTKTKVVCITQRPAINLTATVVNSCICAGSITVNATGGTPCAGGAYTYQKLPSGLPQASNVFTNLCVGCYTIKVTDCNGCTKTIIKCVAASGALPGLTAVTTNVLCNSGNTGSICIINAAGGNNPCLKYALVNPSCIVTPANLFTTNPCFTGLTAGAYCVKVKDTCTGCETCICVSISQPPPINLTATSVNTCSCTGSITVNAIGGTPCPPPGSGYTYQLLPGGPIQFSNTFNNLCVGCYTIKVTDCNGCTSTIVKCITPIAPIIVTPVIINPSCFGSTNGQIILAGINNPCRQYRIGATCNDLTNPFTNVPVFTGLAAGNYCIKVKDTCTGCETCICVTLTQPLPVVVTTTVTNACPGMNNGTASAAVTGGSPAYTYMWSNGQTTPTSTGLFPGMYTVVVTDANGCTASAIVLVGVSPCNPVVLNLQVFIQGYYTGGNAMSPVLFNQGVSSNMNITDEITVELHSAVAPYGFVASTVATLHTDGMATCTFNSAGPGNYYIVVKHRNALQTWSATPIQLNAASNMYNFTTSSSKAYGDNMIEVEPGKWAMYSGDITLDENIDLSDFSQYENDANNFLFGYLSTDLNGDGTVDLLDSPPLDNNIANFIYTIHP